MTLIGVVGYSQQSFNKSKARKLISNGLDEIMKEYPDEYVIVSGLTNIGIPKIAYEEATSRGWKTVGVACEKANNYVCYPVDEEIIVGDDWGDESETLIRKVDVLVRIGGGKQTHNEVKMARERGVPVYEFDL